MPFSRCDRCFFCGFFVDLLPMVCGSLLKSPNSVSGSCFLRSTPRFEFRNTPPPFPVPGFPDRPGKGPVRSPAYLTNPPEGWSFLSLIVTSLLPHVLPSAGLRFVNLLGVSLSFCSIRDGIKSFSDGSAASPESPFRCKLSTFF